jgi:PAS domain S-box-containing protein
LTDYSSLEPSLWQLLNATEEAVIQFGPDWRCLYLNAAALRMLKRRNREDLLGKVLWEEYPALVGTPFQTNGLRAQREGREVAYEEFYAPLSTWLRVRAVPDGASGVVTYLMRDVTSERQRKSQRLLDAGLVGILNWTIDGAVVDANDTLLQMLGYTREDLAAGRINWVELTPPEMRGRDAQPVEDLRTTGRHLPFEKEYIRRDGTRVPVLVASAFNEGSRSEGVSFVVDISAQKKAQAEAEARGREMEAIFASMTDAFFALDQDWRFTFLNREAERVLLRQPEELVGKSIWEEFPAAVGSEFETQYRRAMRDRTTVSFQAYYPPPLDSWYEVRAYPSPTGAGLSVYFRNVNEERRREQEREQLIAEQQRLVTALEQANARQKDSLEQSADALRASEERFRLLLEGVRDYAIFMLDPEGNVATWNAGAERFKGYKADEIIGQHFSRFYTPEDIARRHPWNELVIATREGRYEEEGWRVRKDGSRFWSSVVITALRDEHGELRGFAKVTRDVTERRMREQERATAEALEQQRRFLKDVLLSVTEGRLALCDSPGDLPSPLSPEPVGKPILLSARTLKTVRARVGEAAVKCALSKESANDLLTAASECAMNAIQHAGGGTARVYGDSASGTVQVWVEDMGKGIDLSNIPRATLEPGFSTGGGGIGHGFSLMIACCRRVFLLTGTGGTTIVLEQQRNPPLPAWLSLEANKQTV